MKLNNIIKVSSFEEHNVVPFGLQERSLHLAVSMPHELVGISAATGYRIIPWVSPELRIEKTLERFYGIPRKRRSVPLSNFPMPFDPIFAQVAVCLAVSPF